MDTCARIGYTGKTCRRLESEEEKEVKILYATSEARPYFKTGGLGDVSRALPDALHRRGHEVQLCMPGYPSALEHMHAGAHLEPIDVPWPSRLRRVDLLLDDVGSSQASALFL